MNIFHLTISGPGVYPGGNRAEAYIHANLESPVNLACMSLDRWRKLEYPESNRQDKMQTPHRNAPARIQTQALLAVKQQR